MTYGSLFSGIGGIDLGLDRAGLECRWQIEIDPYCRKVLEKHWPGVKRYEDIRTVSGRDIEPVDLLAGGFPCQDISQAGKRAGIEASRSGLWFEFARLIGEVGPRFVSIENVAGLLVHDAMRRVVGELAGLGYVGLWLCLRASDFGASHQRKRVFLVAYRKGGGRRELRESPRQNGFTYRCHKELAHAGLSGSGWPEESSGEHRQRTSGDDCGTSRTLADSSRHEQPGLSGQSGRLRRRGVCEAGEPVADTSNGFLLQPGWGPQGRDGSGSASEILSDFGSTRLPDTQQAELSGSLKQQQWRTTAELCGASFLFAPGPGDSRWPDILRNSPDLAPAIEAPPQSEIRGVADGLSDRLDRAMSNRTKRLSRLGNAVVPEIYEWIGRRILEADEAFRSEVSAK